MKLNMFRSVIVCAVLSTSFSWAESVEYDFNNFEDGPIATQHEWNVYDMVKDSSGLSIINGVGSRGVEGDRALVLRKSGQPIRCVAGEPMRWLPGYTLRVEYDFRLGTAADELEQNKPVLTFMIGNPLLSEKVSWSVGIEARPDGDWELVGAMPDAAKTKIYGEDFLIRHREDISLSDWYRFKLVVKKTSEPDTFESSVEIIDAKGKLLTSLKFTSKTKDKVTREMWSLPRVHAGFRVDRNQYGLAVIDNLSISSAKE